MRAGGRNESGLVSPTVLGFLIASVVAIFTLSVLLATISIEDEPIGPTIASRSAIGYQGLYTLLQRLELQVGQSRIDAYIAPGRGGVLILDEPDIGLMAKGQGADLFKAPNVLVVLPKWSGEQDIFHDGWVSKTKPLDLETPRQVLALVDKQALVVREQAAAWTRNVIGVTPAFDGQVQLITHSFLTPLVGTGDKMLLGAFSTAKTRIWVLADPDPLENHGLATPANALFALALVNTLRRGKGRVVFDETAHGVVAPDRNPIKLLFQFPFVIVTIQILAAIALLLLATTARFGGAETPPSPFTLGKTRLIDNIASLMDRAGHQAIVLRRYISVKLAEAARALHAPVGLDDAALAQWLDRVAATRGIELKAAAIVARSATAWGGRSKIVPRLFDDARDMYRWTQDLLQKDMPDGSGGR